LKHASNDGEKAGPRSIDWSRVARVVYRVRQHYRYTYTAAIRDLEQQLVMIPPDRHRDQRLLAHRLDIRGTAGACSLTWEANQFGNRVARVLAERVPRSVDFEAHYRVERRSAARGRAGSAGSPDAGDLDTYRQPTALTAPDHRLEAAARALAEGNTDPRVVAERVHDWAAGAIRYQLGVTGVQTPAAMALHLGRGVCQDYAHLMLCVLRLLKIPARYVSGHLLGEGAPHAWVEVLFEDPSTPGGLDVVAYDPTHHRRAGLSYITVALGRDYADITPTSGVFSGPGAGQLHWSKQAEILEFDYARKGAAPEAAA
jgi:transglutaminase-like putative cysteine protease